MATANEATKPRWERAVEAIFRGMWERGVLYGLIAVCLGLALWPLTNIEAMPYIVKTDLTVPQRSQAMLAVAISVVVTTAGYLLVWLRGRRHESGLRLDESFRRTNRYAFILLALPLPFQPARRPRMALGFFVGAVLLYCGLVGYYAVIDHHNLGTAIYDLGIYDNAVWQTAHGPFLDCTGPGPAGSAGSAPSARPATGTTPRAAPGKAPSKAAGPGGSATGGNGTATKEPAGVPSP